MINIALTFKDLQLTGCAETAPKCQEITQAPNACYGNGRRVEVLCCDSWVVSLI